RSSVSVTGVDAVGPSVRRIPEEAAVGRWQLVSASRRSQDEDAIHLGSVAALRVTPDAANLVPLGQVVVDDAKPTPPGRLGCVYPYRLGEIQRGLPVVLVGHVADHQAEEAVPRYGLLGTSEELEH